MRILSKEELEQNPRSLVKELKEQVFIYPTDSIYGIGCDATNQELVQKVRELKNSTIQPFSIIPPNKEWVYDNCEISHQAKEWIEKLGTQPLIEGKEQPFSIILKLKNKQALAHNVLQGKDTVSIRIPDHWFSYYIQKMSVPIITTSANPTGGNFMTNIDDLHERIKTSIELCVYEGEKKGHPSTLVFCHEDPITVEHR
jgi:L-threonylcarbamoyladenylate synthase